MIRDRPNVCKSIHIPAQSGSTANLERMRRGYTREAYLTLVDRIRELVPGTTFQFSSLPALAQSVPYFNSASQLRPVGFGRAMVSFISGYSLILILLKVLPSQVISSLGSVVRRRRSMLIPFPSSTKSSMILPSCSPTQ